MLTTVYKDDAAPLSAGRPVVDRDQAPPRDRLTDWLDPNTPLPLGISILIWAALSGLGWGLIYLIFRLI